MGDVHHLGRSMCESESCIEEMLISTGCDSFESSLSATTLLCCCFVCPDSNPGVSWYYLLYFYNYDILDPTVGRSKRVFVTER